MGFLEDMADHDEEFKQAEPAKQSAMFSDGTHQAIVTICRVEEGQFGWQWVLGFRGEDSKLKVPASVRSWYNLPPDPEREWEAGRLAGDLLLLGYNYEDGGLSGIEGWCASEEAMHVLCTIGVKRKAGETRDYVNVYLNAVHGKVEASQVERYTGGVTDGDESSDADFASGADDDIPF